MKRILLALLLCVYVLTARGAVYSSSQEALRTGVETNLKKAGIPFERRSDGLMFTKGGENYYIEIDENEQSPMYIRLCKYIKFNDKFRRQDALKELPSYNNFVGVKAYCKEKNLILSAEMFVTSAVHFNDVFDNLLALMEKVLEDIDN